MREATKRAIAVAKESGAVISFDPNLRPPLWKSLEDARVQVAYGLGQCDVLKISDNEIQWFTGEEDFDAGIARLREQYQIPLILLSMGRDGSRAYYKDLKVDAAPFLQESTIETTGAGDTFGGSCLHYILKYGLDKLDEEKLKEMLTFANAAASIVTTRKGALRVMPEVEEVESFIQSQKVADTFFMKAAQVLDCRLRHAGKTPANFPCPQGGTDPDRGRRNFWTVV